MSNDLLRYYENQADYHLRLAGSAVPSDPNGGSWATAAATAAVVNATLALAHEQRTANLLTVHALVTASHPGQPPTDTERDLWEEIVQRLDLRSIGATRPGNIPEKEES